VSIQLPAFLRNIFVPAVAPRTAAPASAPVFLRDSYNGTVQTGAGPVRTAAVDDAEPWLPGDQLAPTPANPATPANPSRPVDFSPLPPPGFSPQPPSGFSPQPPNGFSPQPPADFSPLPPPGFSPAPVAAPPPPPPPPPPPAPVPPAPVPPALPAAPSVPGVQPAAMDDGAAPDPKALRKAILDYRDAIMAWDKQNAGQEASVFSNVFHAGPVMLLPGMMVPYGARMLTEAWLGREPSADELARFTQLMQTKGARDGMLAVMDDIGNRGLLARLKRTDGSPAAINAIRAQVGAMLQWQQGDALGQANDVVPPIPAGPALDPVRQNANPAVAGTPNKDRANSADAQAKLRAAIQAYGQAVSAEMQQANDPMIGILAGQFSGNTVMLLPGLMLPHGANMLMLAWLGREATPEELAKWQGWQQQDARKAFADIMQDIERTGLAARLPETDGSAAAVTALHQEVAAKFTWR
jgi:hypothetical protein